MLQGTGEDATVLTQIVSESRRRGSSLSRLVSKGSGADYCTSSLEFEPNVYKKPTHLAAVGIKLILMKRKGLAPGHCTDVKPQAAAQDFLAIARNVAELERTHEHS